MILYISVVLMFAISLISAAPAEVAEQEAGDEAGQVVMPVNEDGAVIFNRSDAQGWFLRSAAEYGTLIRYEPPAASTNE